VNVDCDASTAPTANVTWAVFVMAPMVAVTVSACDTVLSSVTEHVSAVPVLQLVLLYVVEVPSSLKLTICALMGLFVASLTVTCTVVALTPSSGTELGSVLPLAPWRPTAAGRGAPDWAATVKTGRESAGLAARPRVWN
jgi:hypothetical protein